MTTYQFQSHDGHELEARLVGEPGKRTVAFTRLSRRPVAYGQVDLWALLCVCDGSPTWRGVLTPGGRPVAECRDEDLILLDMGVIETLQFWAQEAALGRQESDYESVYE